MSADDVAKLFRIDVRLASPGTEGEHGNGIGLILCHELVSLNQGRIEVTSEPEKGSTFTLILPVAEPAGT
jgi:signal transduction histidine kinase